ncbi:MAG TPA: helix-turn-helix domain-containing protein [Rhizomicrobium sp.]|nr:helix-turn-helix domain-containing protein [Rhizomicrobium sp.]
MSESHAALHAVAHFASAESHVSALPERNEAALEALHNCGTVSRFGRNQTIFNEGDDARYSYRVVEGGVRLCKLMPDGRRQIAEFMLPGDLFGFEFGDEHSLTAEALGDVVVMRCARSHMERLSDEQPAIRKQLMSHLRRELSSAQIHLVMLGRQTAKERVASFLLLLAERGEAQDGDTVALPMSRQDIADYLGLTIETVCRALSDLKRERIIGVPNRHEVQIRNITALETIAECDE